jgi:hypothetical protein
MGATIELYRLSDAKLQNKGLYFIPHKQVREMSDEEFNALWETKDTDRWEDGKKHELIDISYYLHMYGNTRGWRRVKDRFDRLPVQYGVVDCNSDVHSYIVADNVMCYSGRVLKNRYYKKETTLNVCTKQDEVISFFDQYGGKDHQWTLSDILEKWDEQSFLIVAY